MTQKVAYVTGGMGGIGTAICQRLAKDGFKVIAGCGPTRPIRCGIVTLVPGVGLAPDPTRILGAALPRLARRLHDAGRPAIVVLDAVGPARLDDHRFLGLGDDHDRGQHRDESDSNRDQRIAVGFEEVFHHWAPSPAWVPAGVFGAGRRRTSCSGRYGVTPGASITVLSVLRKTRSMVS